MLREAIANHPPSSKSGKLIKFFYGTQVDIEPPTFVFFCTDPKAIHFSYRRYLENQLREQFAFTGTPIRISFRGREDADL
jgi:GTP-binding protein